MTPDSVISMPAQGNNQNYQTIRGIWKGLLELFAPSALL